MAELLTRTKNAARIGNRDFDLTLNFIRRLAATTKGCCSVTGKQFSLVTVHGSNRRPFAPSIDRVDCSKGYVIDNVRLVCVSVNVALGDWGEGVLYHLAELMVEKYQKQKPALLIDCEFKPNARKGRSEKWIKNYTEKYYAVPK